MRERQSINCLIHGRTGDGVQDSITAHIAGMQQVFVMNGGSGSVLLFMETMEYLSEDDFQQLLEPERRLYDKMSEAGWMMMPSSHSIHGDARETIYSVLMEGAHSGVFDVEFVGGRSDDNGVSMQTYSSEDFM